MQLDGDSLRRAGQRGPTRDPDVREAQRAIVAIIHRATRLCLGAGCATDLEAGCADVLQHVLAIAHRFHDANPNTRGRTASPASWVYAKALGYARNFRRQLHSQSPPDLIEYDDDAAGLDVLSDDEERRVLSMLDEATTPGLFEYVLTHLEDVYRDVLALYCLGGLSDAEIADDLGITDSAAKSRRQRGLRRLRRVLTYAPSPQAGELARRLDEAQRPSARRSRRSHGGGAA